MSYFRDRLFLQVPTLPTWCQSSFLSFLLFSMIQHPWARTLETSKLMLSHPMHLWVQGQTDTTSSEYRVKHWHNFQWVQGQTLTQLPVSRGSNTDTTSCKYRVKHWHNFLWVQGQTLTQLPVSTGSKTDTTSCEHRVRHWHNFQWAQGQTLTQLLLPLAVDTIIFLIILLL